MLAAAGFSACILLAVPAQTLAALDECDVQAITAGEVVAGTLSAADCTIRRLLDSLHD